MFELKDSGYPPSSPESPNLGDSGVDKNNEQQTQRPEAVTLRGNSATKDMIIGTSETPAQKMKD